MKNLIKLNSVLIAAGLAATSGFAQADVYYDYARVKSVTPVYDYVKVGGPTERCYPTRYKHRKHRNGNPTVLGAIVGGAIGNAVGGDSEATLAGVLIGGAIGSASHTSRRYGEVCETVYQPVRKVRELTGYKVRYRYNGKRYSSIMRHHPGDTVKIRVKVSPVIHD